MNPSKGVRAALHGLPILLEVQYRTLPQRVSEFVRVAGFEARDPVDGEQGGGGWGHTICCE